MELFRRVRSQGFTTKEFRRVCVVALVLLAVIVVSGASVRLTGSGLGCDDWPNCNDDTFVDVSSKHAAIEQVNRLFTFLVGFGVVLAAIAAWYRRPRRRDLLWLAGVMLVGVPAQGLVGAVVVWTDLHPATVQLHFVLSMVLVWAAVLLLVRSGEVDGSVTGRRARPSSVVPRVRTRVRLLAVWTGLAVIAGTVVTGTGPHAGDAKGDSGVACSAGAARRFFGEECDVNGDALVWVTRAHGTIVWVTVLIALSLMWKLRRLPHDREVLNAPLSGWLLIAIAQGAIGYVQYASRLPVGLVAAHVAGATALVACTAWLWAVTTRPAD
ncbi:MAG: heme A synthase [Actinobacteria bacterium]|nr:heme A synthase [Actinomycetota bacterium]